MPTSPSVRIANEIRRRIHAGELRAGELVPSTRQIAREWGVAIATATRALALLRQDRLVEAVPGAGTRVAGPTRRRSSADYPQVTREGIIARAIAIADADGLEALSMRQLAADLGIPTMSLYRHVASKEELTLAMADRVIAEEPLSQVRPAGWRRQLELLARWQWQGYARHPWLPHAISMTRPQMIPHGIAQTEWALQSLDGLGADLETMMQAVITLFAYVRGMAVNLQAEADAQQETGLTADEWVESQSGSMTKFTDAGPYPLLSQVTRQANMRLDLSTLFEYGLTRMLDGFAIQFRARAASIVRVE